MSELIKITDADFDETVEGSDVPVLVFFTAVWCGPCKMVLPGLQALKDGYQGKVLFCAMDADENPKAVAKFGIRSVPVVLIFKNGPGSVILGSQIGSVPKEIFATFINKYVG
ncbi:thioredoxin family protein [Pseudomonas sp. NPDC090201]|uniref:thioredoxin family protein n=1 Tax=Pseudomonas sp. NPDC090201 TaxID=3364475 RepID=UPI00380F2D4F